MLISSYCEIFKFRCLKKRCTNIYIFVKIPKIFFKQDQMFPQTGGVDGGVTVEENVCCEAVPTFLIRVKNIGSSTDERPIISHCGRSW